jgi:hypothetical protein
VRVATRRVRGFLPVPLRKDKTMRKTVAIAVIPILAALLLGGASLAEDKKGDAPDEKALVEAMMTAATPGVYHKHLDDLAGSWDAAVKVSLDPSKPPTESKATSETKWIMGNRYLEEKVLGEFGGMKFLGQGLTGYDNLQKKYTTAWIDNMGTGISTSTGSYDAGKKTFTFHGEEIDPLSGKKVKDKTVIHVIDKNTHEETMYKVVGDKEVEVMHITYTRKAEK